MQSVMGQREKTGPGKELVCWSHAWSEELLVLVSSHAALPGPKAWSGLARRVHIRWISPPRSVRKCDLRACTPLPAKIGANVSISGCGTVQGGETSGIPVVIRVSLCAPTSCPGVDPWDILARWMPPVSPPGFGLRGRSRLRPSAPWAPRQETNLDLSESRL